VLAGIIRTEGAKLISFGTAADPDGALRIAATADTFGAGFVLAGQVFQDGAEVLILGIELLAKVFPVVHIHHFLEALGSLRQDGGEVAKAAVESAAGDVFGVKGWFHVVFSFEGHSALLRKRNSTQMTQI